MNLVYEKSYTKMQKIGMLWRNEMRAYISDFCKLISFPKEACVAFEQAYDKIEANNSTRQAFAELLQSYEDDMLCEFQGMLIKMTELSTEAGVHEYTGHMLLMICLSKTLKKYYQLVGVDEKIWYTSMCDIKYKLDECKCVFDIWGSFVASWYEGFFRMTRFGFVKLQCELCKFEKDYEKDGIVLTPESMVINVHIPRTGTKLDRESLQQSYKEASDFFKDKLGERPHAFVCSSWLLFPRNLEVLDPSSNLYNFISGYDILNSENFLNYGDVWRLFDVKYEGDVEKLPQDTSLRRAYADWIRKGEKTGWGFGVQIYQGR